MLMFISTDAHHPAACLFKLSLPLSSSGLSSKDKLSARLAEGGPLHAPDSGRTGRSVTKWGPSWEGVHPVYT